MNFDGSVRDDQGGAGFVIHGLDGRLLIVDGFHLFELSVPTVELHVAWIGVTFVRQ